VRRPFTVLQRLKRLTHLKLVVPLLRSQHPPEHTARAVMVGLFWAFTPLIGIQMYLVGLTWALGRWHHRFGFNLLIALAWTWVTNVFTMLPIYYVFYIVGQFMLGNLDAATGYDKFVRAWQAALDAEGVVGPLIAYAEVVATEQALPLVLGSIPFSLGGAWLGYRWSLRYVIQRRKARAARIARKAERAATSGHPGIRPVDAIRHQAPEHPL
jgi:uncharacterized protein